MNRWCFAVILALISEIFTWAVGTAVEQRAGPGLSVSQEGILLLEGKPFRGIGVNYFNAFARVLNEKGNRSYERGFDILRKEKIPFARIMACGFWPVEMQSYLTNKAEYFETLDAVVRSAEQNGVGLILSLFWQMSTVPDLAGEPCDHWGQPESKTHDFMRGYTREVVRRYRGSNAVWGWEFGNEHNLAADLPNGAEHRPPVVPTLGTPNSRSKADEISHVDFRTALREFGKEVRRHDPHRIILSGNSFPRVSAWNQMREKSWNTDSREQSEEMLLGDNPDPVDTITVRCYHDNLERIGWAMDVASRAKKPLIVGEFGVPGADTIKPRDEFEKILGTIERQKVPLAALWVFDYEAQKEWNVAKGSGRWYQMEAIRKANQRMNR